MKKNRFIQIFIVFFILITINSCSHPEKYIYFQHKGNDTLATIVDSIPKYQAVFQVDDIVSIMVSSINPEAVKPFNTTSSISDKNEKASSSTGYLIDADGNIEFPILGTLKIAGLNRIDATELIKSRLKEYVKDPIVNIRLQNFKITILGDVSRPGVYSFNQERITLPEVLGTAGDLNLTGSRSNVKVIREIDGKKIETNIDLTSRDIFRSSVYYLHQNDIIYIEPSKIKINSTRPIAVYGSIAVSGLSLLVSIFNIITR